MYLLFYKMLFWAALSLAIPVAEKHPFHVSATEMEYVQKDKKIEISSKIFTDDFEAVLSKLYNTKVDFSNAALKIKMDELVKKYITTHLSVRSDGKLLPLQLYGWEIDHEAVFVYTIAAAQNFNTKNITIENTILYDLFDDQMNIVHFLTNGQRKSAKLNYPDRKMQIGF